MADLDDSSFTAVNDIETAQGAPVSEALAQKYGSNENNLDTRSTSNDADIATNAANIATNVTDIATNVTDIATNAAAIAAGPGVESVVAGGVGVGTSFGTVLTFSNTLTAATLSGRDAGQDINITVVIKAGTVTRVGTSPNGVEFQTNGVTVEAKRDASSTFDVVDFVGIGFS